MTRAMQVATFFILTSLAEEARHGYGIMRDIGRISSGSASIGPGTLYAALDRLRAEGLVTIERDEIVDTRVRRYYALTDNGRQALEREAQKIHSASAVALRRLSSSAGIA